MVQTHRMLHETSEIGHYSGNKRDIDAEYEEVEEVRDPNEAQDWMEKANSDEIQSRFLEKYKNQISKAQSQGEPKEITYLCGSSHIDISWCWRYLQASEKARVTFEKACFHVEHIPEYTFSGSQSLLFDWVRIRYPELFNHIQRAVATERFEMVGGSWVEYDGHLPSGEALVRQRLYGQIFLKRYFCSYASIEYLPDSFGFAIQLPQILKKSNAKAFYTNKIGSNIVNKFPFCTFLWEAPDGTRILVESLNSASRNLLNRGMQEKISPFSYETEDFENAGVFSSDNVPCKILPYGKGDGGHGPTGEEVQERLFQHKQALITLAPVHTYFDRVEAECLDRLPVWRDELYLEWHRGTMTTHSLVKRMNRHNEGMLLAMEKLCVLASLNARHEYPNDILGESWRTTLLNQFHDVLPGSCIPETYDDCWDMWKWQIENHERVVNDALATLVTGLVLTREKTQSKIIGDTRVKAQVIHFNPIDCAVKTTVEIPTQFLGGATPRQVLLEDGSTHGVSRHPKVECPGEPFYEIPERIAFPMELKPHRLTVISFLDDLEIGKQQTLSHHVDENVVKMQNQNLMVTIDKATGAITSLKFLRGGEWHESLQQGKKQFREDFPEMGPGIMLHAFFDAPKDFAAWNINPRFREHPYSSRAIAVGIADAGDNHVTAETVVEHPTQNPEKLGSMEVSTVTTRYTLHYDDPMLYVTMQLSFRGKRVTMKYDIPTSTRGTNIEAAVAYGVDRRSTVPKTARNKERWENVMHEWANIQAPDNSWGFAVINNGKYGIDYSRGYMGISIIRGQDYPNAHFEAWVYKERFARVDSGKGYQASWTDQGNHVVKLALYPHPGTAIEAKVLERAQAFNTPLIACNIPNSPGQSRSLILPSLSLPMADSPVCITAVKPAERNGELNVTSGRLDEIKQRIVIRAVNMGGKITTSMIDISGLPVKEVVECDLIERKTEGHFNLTSDGMVITKLQATWKPYEIKTFGLLL